MIKKIKYLLVCLSMVFCLTACGSSYQIYSYHDGRLFDEWPIEYEKPITDEEQNNNLGSLYYIERQNKIMISEYKQDSEGVYFTQNTIYALEFDCWPEISNVYAHIPDTIAVGSYCSNSENSECVWNNETVTKKEYNAKRDSEFDISELFDIGICI